MEAINEQTKKIKIWWEVDICTLSIQYWGTIVGEAVKDLSEALNPCDSVLSQWESRNN